MGWALENWAGGRRKRPEFEGCTESVEEKIGLAARLGGRGGYSQRKAARVSDYLEGVMFVSQGAFSVEFGATEVLECDIPLAYITAYSIWAFDVWANAWILEF